MRQKEWIAVFKVLNINYLFFNMNRKITNFLALALTAMVGVGLVGSCKDYDEDQYEDLTRRLANQERTLSEEVADNIESLQDQIDSLKQAQQACKNRCDSALAVLADSADNHAQIYQMIADLKAKDKNLQDAIDSLSAVTDTNQVGSTAYILNTKAAAAAAAAKAAGEKADSIADAIVGWGDSLRTAYQNAADAWALAVRDSIRINVLDSLNEKQDERIDSLADVTDSLFDLAEKNLQKAQQLAQQADSVLKEELLDSIDAKLQDVIDAYKAADQKLQNQISSLKASVKGLKKRLDDVEDAIDDLEDRMDDVEDAMDKQITSVVVQGTMNPVFGSFSWPIGIRSNILMAYYGEYASSVKFPTTQTGHLVDGCYAFDATDASLLGTLDNNTIAAGTILSDSANNAGKIYITVNPNTADLTGAEFTLVNSRNKEVITLGDLTPSEDTLKFGSTGFLTRGSVTTQDNEAGFYEAPVQITASDLDNVKINIDNGLKSALKDAADGTVDLSAIASGVYNQLNGVMEAAAVKATWTDNYGTHSTFSNYEVGVAAIKPLSYHTLSGVSKTPFPVISSLGDFSFSVSHISNIDLSTITFTVGGANASIKFGDVTISPSTGSVQVTVDVPSAISTTTGDVTAYTQKTYPIENLSAVFTDVQTNLNASIDGWETSVNDSLNALINSVTSSINSEVNNMLTQISGQLTDTVNDMLDDVAASVTNNFSSYISKMNSYISKVNKVTSKLNSLLGDINSKLQVVLIYKGADGNYHQMSNSSSVPTIFTGTGSIALMPTSYTAEIVTPAYKKFVAVTDVINGTASARGGDATCVSVLQQTNNDNEYLNTVLEGGRYEIAFAPAQSGYTYEIAYSAIDYDGWISTRKFYVTVK